MRHCCSFDPLVELGWLVFVSVSLDGGPLCPVQSKTVTLGAFGLTFVTYVATLEEDKDDGGDSGKGHAGRTYSWWQNFVNDTVLPEEWKENVRMQTNNFKQLCAQLKPFLQREETNMRMLISVECQVAATLYYLSDERRMRKTSQQ